MVKAVFIHIPKTAGSSFRGMLEAAFGVEAVSPPFPASCLTTEDAERLRQYDVISGHISANDVRTHFPGAKLFTILRNPVDRCISWYYYARTVGENKNSDVIAAQSHDIDEFFKLDVSVIYRNIFNRQIRQLGGHVFDRTISMETAFSQAVDTLRECCWVGHQETLEADVVKLASIFPEMENVELPRVNVTPNRKIIGQVSDTTAKAIRSLNEWDAQLPGITQ